MEPRQIRGAWHQNSKIEDLDCSESDDLDEYEEEELDQENQNSIIKHLPWWEGQRQTKENERLQQESWQKEYERIPKDRSKIEDLDCGDFGNLDDYERRRQIKEYERLQQ